MKKSSFIAVSLEKERQLVKRAKTARRRAISWRGFRVGCALITEDARGRRRIFAGFNVKARQEDSTLCAERMALTRAENAGFDRVIAVAVSGRPQYEEGDLNPTLHCCPRCRAMFAARREAAEIRFTFAYHGAVERFLLPELLLFHGDVTAVIGSTAATE